MQNYADKKKVDSNYVAFMMSFFSLYYILSLYLLKLNVFGDQIAYILLYQILEGARFDQIADYQYRTTSSSEPIYGIIMWIGANLGIDKNYYVSGFNALFVSLILHMLIKKNIKISLILLIITNFYIFALVTNLERLKFALLFLLISYILKSRLRYAFIALSAVTHYQSLLNVLAFLPKYIKNIYDNRKRNKIYINVMLGGGVALSISIFSYYFYINSFNAISTKLDIYSANSENVESRWYFLLLLILVGLIISDRRLLLIFTLAPVFLVALYVGTQRVNIIGVLVFYMFLIEEGKGNHFFNYIMMGYFSFKSINYVENIVYHGNGYYSS